ncbi:chemotaxis protein CheW [candidate division KSB1 bacterium]|nr:chemotaxis protein CheW [candidate division KSB1 bacterium]
MKTTSKKDTETKLKKLSQSQINKILGERAKEMALQEDDIGSHDDAIEVVEFELAYEKYAIESKYVSEVYPMSDFSILPCTPSFIMGIMNLRGTILSLIDIRRFFGLPIKGLSNLNRVLVVRTDDLEMGLLADFIMGVKIIPKEHIQPPLPTFSPIQTKYLKGVTKDSLILLDIEKIFSDPSIIVNEEPDV